MWYFSVRGGGGGWGGALILTMCFPSSVCFCHVFFPLLPFSASVSMAAGTADTVIEDKTEDKEVISDSKWNVAGNWKPHWKGHCMNSRVQTHTHNYVCFIYSCLSVSAKILPLCYYLCSGFPALLLIIIMYIYHALINTLSAHVIHINLNVIFYTHIEHSATKTICLKYYTKKAKKKKAL